MISFEGYDGGTPTHAFATALSKADPDLVYLSGDHRADLLVVPRSTQGGTHRATSTAWYDLYWVHNTVTLAVAEDGLGDVWPRPDTERISRAGVLPPPPRIPFEDRLAAAPPPTLDGMSADQVAMFGGPQGVLDILSARQRIALREDHSVAAYDWDSLATTAVGIIRGLGDPPKLTPGQRAQVAAARLLRLRDQVYAAETSLEALRANADKAGDFVPYPVRRLATDCRPDRSD